MTAWILSPPTPLGEAAVRLLEVEGWKVERLGPGDAAPPGRPDLVLLLHWDPIGWEDLASVLEHSGSAPAIYAGPQADDALQMLPVDVALRSLRGATLRVALEQMGLPWGPARAPAQR